MRKVLLLMVAGLLLSFAAMAQGTNGSRNAIGVRFGWGAEVSYQRYIAPSNRIEATMGFNRYGFSAEGTYQWVFDIPSPEKGDFRWYVGGGIGMGDWSNKKFDKGFSFGLLAQGGIEYSFSDIPLLLSLDYRPGIYVAPEAHFDFTGFGVGVRFRF